VIHQQWQLWLLGWALAIGLLGTLYLVQLRTRDATAVDAGWALSVTLIAVLDAVLGPGDLSHRALIAAIAGLENLRVALVVIRRLGRREDTRYQELRRRWRERGREQLTFAIFYQAQGLLAALLAAPFVLASFNHHSGLEPIEWAGAALWVVAVAFETVADEQLRRFKAQPANRGTTLRTGLWRYSRHPNYFFQSLTWIAYALVAVAAPWGWIGFLAPILILYFVLFVTGIPPSEEEALRHRGDDYRSYQRETSAFIPWYPRRTDASRAR
jgi:steroid 5-alpha reductase family enzyme